jgi:hypothetical protein
VTSTRLELTREQIIAFRRHAGALDERLPSGPPSLRRAAWVGLQNSMPRAALLSLHARVHGIQPSTVHDPSLVQLWGPRYSVYVVAAGDVAVFTLGRLPDEPGPRRRAEVLAARLRALLGSASVDGSGNSDSARLTDVAAGHALGERHNRLRYAAPTGTVLSQWDGARAPTIWTVPPPEMDPRAARLELARRFLHVFGPATPDAFAQWAGIARRLAHDTFHALHPALTPVHTPVGDAWLLAQDEPTCRGAPAPPAPTRLLPSGDAFFLLDGAGRTLLVPDAAHRQELWPSRVWPGALLLDGDIAGTWRRAEATVTIHPWRRLSPAERHAVEAEACSLPLPSRTGSPAPISVQWNT